MQLARGVLVIFNQTTVCVSEKSRPAFGMSLPSQEHKGPRFCQGHVDQAHDAPHAGGVGVFVVAAIPEVKASTCGRPLPRLHSPVWWARASLPPIPLPPSLCLSLSPCFSPLPLSPISPFPSLFCPPPLSLSSPFQPLSPFSLSP